MSSDGLKTIEYRGGLVRFRIPDDWAYELGGDGGGEFYRLGEDTGTLRLFTSTFSAPAGRTVTGETAAENLKDLAAKLGALVEPLRDGVALVRYDTEEEENGVPLVIRYWTVYQAVPPSHLRIANFSYTLHAEQVDDPVFAFELELLDREVRAAEFASNLGCTPAKKPWWQFW